MIGILIAKIEKRHTIGIVCGNCYYHIAIKNINGIIKISMHNYRDCIDLILNYKYHFLGIITT